jgi:hypothetical protein
MKGMPARCHPEARVKSLWLATVLVAHAIGWCTKRALRTLLAGGVAPKRASGRGLTGRIRHPGARHQSPSTGVRVRLGRAISYDRLQRVPGRAA